MLINIDLKTCSKYIHANEATITNQNKVLDTSLLSEKGKKLFIDLFKNNFYGTVPLADYDSFVLEYEQGPIVIPPVPVTFTITKAGNKLTLAFSEAVKFKGVPLESYTGTPLDFIKDVSVVDPELTLLDQCLDLTKMTLEPTATSVSLTLQNDFFIKEVFKMLDDSATSEVDLWAGNDDGIYRVNFTVAPEIFTAATDDRIATTASDPVTKITVYTSASETVEVHTEQDYTDSTIYGVFDDTLVY